MQKLTAENYHSYPHPHISNSMVNAYIKSPSLYKRRFIDKEPACQIKISDPMKKGSALDELLTNGENTKYVVNPYDGRTKAGKEFKAEHDVDHIINDAILSDVVAMFDTISKQPFWKKGLKKRIFQKPSEGKIEGVLCKSLPDWIDPLDKKTRMVDLKTTTAKNMETAYSWKRTCLDRGYFRQAAHFQELYHQETGISKADIPFYWAVVATDTFEPGRVVIRLYKAPQHLIDEALKETKEALRGIKAKKFTDTLATYETAEEIN